MQNLSFFLLMALSASVGAVNTDKMINCYLGSWANDNRWSSPKFEPELIQPHLCTHISYAFFGIKEDGTFDASHTYMGPHNDWIKRIVDLKWDNSRLKVLAVVGGRDHSSARFSRMAASKSSRTKFIESTLEYLEENQLDGLDLQWLSPGSTGVRDDRVNFLTLLQEIAERFRIQDYEFGISVTGDADYIRDWYHIPQIVKHVKFINILTYNYTGAVFYIGNYAWKFHAPIRRVMSTIDYWLESGAPAKKLNLGIALIGRFFTDPEHPMNETFLFFRVLEKIHKGKYTFNTDLGASQLFFPKGYKAYYESEQGIQMKMEFAKQKDLGGVMIWTLDSDMAFEPFYPLLSLIFRMSDKGFECHRSKCCLANQSKNCWPFYMENRY